MHGRLSHFATNLNFLVAKPRFIDFATVYKPIAISNPVMGSVSTLVKVFLCGPIPYLGQTLRSVGKKVLHLAFKGRIAQHCKLNRGWKGHLRFSLKY